jgi:hypothetical protein
MPRHSNPNYAVNPVQRRAKTSPDAKRETKESMVGYGIFVGWVGTWGREIEEKWAKKESLGQTGERTRDKLQKKSKGGLSFVEKYCYVLL